ncbi:MAG: hypothetical protein Kow0042_12090 [Calditrichia bacterium]
MYFTRAQIRAIWFIVIIQAIAVGYHYGKYFLFPDPPYDFTEFEESFLQKRDSILAFQGENLSRQDMNSPPPSDKITASYKTFPININTATSEELQKLPRVGPKMAQRIIEYRSQNGGFQSIEEIMQVKGIGEKTFEKLRDLITIE